MLETAELGHAVSKDDYAKAEPKLREALLNAQFDVSEVGRFPVLALISGVEGGGRGEIANQLTEWMDPRHMRVVAFGPRTEYERERPPQTRFWQAFPPKGKLGVFMNAWYQETMVARVMGGLSDTKLDAALEHIRSVERMLTDEGMLLVKFWIHLAKKDQRKRLEALEADRDTRWRVTKEDWLRYKLYSESHEIWERILRETSTGEAPWYVVEGADPRYRNLTVGKILLESMQKRLAQHRAGERRVHGVPPAPVIDNLKLVRDLDLQRKIARKEYENDLEKYQGRLARLVRTRKFAGRSLVLAFEGMDAAGKGGAIRRITHALDARHYRVIPVAAPTDEERAQPYLWRFWRHVPGHGGVTIFDRSWYGRVLVERVEGFCATADWMRAYAEINDFEQTLARNGTIVLKVWLHISLKEQLARFKQREETPFKRFKITAEDYRNRKKWPDYEQAVCDMIERTSTDLAPWTVVEAEDKFYGRIKVLRAVVDRLEQALD